MNLKMKFLILSMLATAAISIVASEDVSKSRRRTTDQAKRKNLDYRGRSLIEFPSSLSKRLRSLDLSNNSISGIARDDLQGLDSLETLSLESNQLLRLDAGSFRDTRYLQTLNLRNNKLLRLQSDHFEGLFRLRVLDLGMNPLSKLDPSTFDVLYQLETLHLDGCNLVAFHTAVVTNLLHLSFLDLAGNYLSTLDLPRMTRKFPPSLRTLRLSDNPWSCGCHTKNLIRQMASVEHLEWESNLSAPVCCHPNQYAGETWREFAEREEILQCQSRHPGDDGPKNRDDLEVLVHRSLACFGPRKQEAEMADSPPAEERSGFVLTVEEMILSHLSERFVSIFLLTIISLELLAVIVLVVVIVALSRRSKHTGSCDSLVL